MTQKKNHSRANVYSSASFGEKPSSWQNAPTGPTSTYVKTQGIRDKNTSDRMANANQREPKAKPRSKNNTN